MNRRREIVWFILIFLAVTVLMALFTIHPPVRQLLWGNKIIYSVPMQEKIVALTYDDGPHPVFTPEVLEILNKYHVKATFFMVGRSMERYPDIVKQVVDRKHIIVNHTYSHPLNIKSYTKEEIIKELDKCEGVIQRLAGKQPYLFRPPRGLINGKVLLTAQNEGYQTVLWSICANRKKAPTPRLMAERVIRSIHGGGIILVHDGSFDTRWKDVEATSMIIESLLKRGYRFVTVPELLRIGLLRTPGRW